MEADGQDPQRWAKSAVLLKSFSRPTVVSLSCMVNAMSSGKALGERERELAGAPSHCGRNDILLVAEPQ